MNVEASGKVSDITHAASSSFPDEQSEWIQDGIDRGGGRLFAPGFLCGFYADTADVPPEVYEPYARAVAGQQLEISSMIIWPVWKLPVPPVSRFFISGMQATC